MTRFLLFTIGFLSQCLLVAQNNPAITSWLQNTTGTGSYYIEGNSMAIDNNILYNCQKVEYSANAVYVSTTGVPAYPTGPFLDRNPSNATDQAAIFKIPLNPVENTGTKTATSGGNIGIFINGVALFDYRDGVSWNPNTNALCGGPGNDRCPGGPMTSQAWNRDAIPAEREGFDCAKGHPAMGNYHHHQNPSAFKLDLEVTSDICNLYDADGLYMLNENQHSLLIGFAYDGFPIYGGYGFKNVDGTGGITRIKSSYQLRNITARTHHADGTDVADGPPISTEYFLGYFREDYEYVQHSEGEYLDEYNGRFAVTPEYPAGTYAYYATVNENWTSAYPYAVGPNYYGIVSGEKVDAITESVTTYTPTSCENNKTFSSNITSGTYQVADTIFSDGQIATSEAVTFQGKVIVLQAGFNVATGATFLAEISPCTAASLIPKNTANLYKLVNKDMFAVLKDADHTNLTVFPNPASDLVAIQVNGMLRQNLQIGLFNLNGKLLKEVQINQGSTMGYIDTRTLYNGTYFIKIFDGQTITTKKVIIQKE